MNSFFPINQIISIEQAKSLFKNYIELIFEKASHSNFQKYDSNNNLEIQKDIDDKNKYILNQNSVLEPSFERQLDRYL